MGTALRQPPETVSVERAVWTIDPQSGSVAFSIKHMAIATVRGRFDRFQGSLVFVGDFPVSVNAEIDAATIHTGISRRDSHLRSADFFDVATYPTISFHSTRIATDGEMGRWHIAGELTIHGVTRPVVLSAVRTSDGAAMWDAASAMFDATTKISRKEFGVGANIALNGSGALVIGDEVTINISVKAFADPTGDQ